MEFFKAKQVQFGFIKNGFNPNLVTLTDIQTYKDNRPTPFGVQSLFLGATRHYPCATCHRRFGSAPNCCQGHEGQIKLNTVVFAPGSIKHVVNVLKKICFFCSSVLQPKSDSNTFGKYVCACCKSCQPISYVVVYGMQIVPIWAKPTNTSKKPTLEDLDSRFKQIALEALTPEKILKIFSRISINDLYTLGFQQPEKTQPKYFVWTYLPVVSTLFRPRNIRPDMIGKGLHDLTMLYRQLLKATIDLTTTREKISLYKKIRGNISLLRKHQLNEHKYNDLKFMLSQLQTDIQVLVWLVVVGQDPRKASCKLKKSMYYKGQHVAVPTRSNIRLGGDGHASLLGISVGNDKINSITRGHVSSKRCDMNARTVIACDVHLDIGQIGIPYMICKTLTFPEKVTDFNKSWLQKMVVAGPNKLFGANVIQKISQNNILGRVSKIGLIGTTKDQRQRFANLLKIGDVVERHLVEGDVVVANRQPTLHEGSIMGHLVKPVPGKAIKLPLYTVNSYNADFDGDEMNIHVPQTEKAKADALHVMGVQHHLLPSQMVVQGGILACYLLTSQDTIFSREQSMNYFMTCSKQNIPEPTILVRDKKGWKSYYTGSDIFSQTLDSQFFLETWDHKELPNDQHILIRNGKLLSGRTNKSILKKLIRNACLTTNSHIAKQFLTDVCRLSYMYLSNCPKSIGPSDMRPLHNVQQKIKIILCACTNIVKKYACELDNDDLQSALMTIMNVISSHVKALVPTRESERSTFHTITTDAQSKGSFHNVIQVTGYHGTNLKKGNLILHDDTTHATRILPCFSHNPSRSELLQFGHVSNSFVQGHTSIESFFDYMSGRVGLVDTAITTGRTGYKGSEIGVNTISRIIHGNYVMNYNTLISPMFFGDGYNPDRVQRANIMEFKMTKQQFDDYLCTLELQPGMEDILHELRLDIMKTKAESCMENMDCNLDIAYNINEIFKSHYYRLHTTINKNNLPILPTKSWLLLDQLHCKMETWACTESIKIMRFYDILSLGKLLKNASFMTAFLSTNFFKKVLFKMEECFAKALYAAGSQCGRITSMRISEKVTQIALDSHRSNGAKHGCDGLKRFETILSLTTTPTSMASMMIDCENLCHATQLANSITTINFDSIFSSIQIENINDHILEDQQIIKLASNLNRISGNHCVFFPEPNHMTYRSKKKKMHVSNQIIRIVINKTRCVDASITISRISKKIEKRFLHFLQSVSTAKTRAYIINASENMNKWIIRLMITQSIEEGLEKKNKSMQTFISMLKEDSVGGIDGIKEAWVGQRTDLVFNSSKKLFEEKVIHYVWTRGTNLKDAIKHPMINPLKLVSNCVRDMEQNFGTLAACLCFYSELKSVMGSKVKDRHIFLLTQSILSNGILCGVNRHGLKKSGTPIAQMCFENGRKVVMRLAMTNATDDCKDDASAILLGRKSCGGTGSVHFKPTTTQQKRKLAMFDINHTYTFKELVKRCRLASKHVSKQPVHNTTKNTNTDLQQAVISALINDDNDDNDNDDDEYDHDNNDNIKNTDKDLHYEHISKSPQIYSPTSPHMYSPSSDNYNIQYSYNNKQYSPTIQPYSPSSPCLSYLATSPTSLYTPLSPTY